MDQQASSKLSPWLAASSGAAWMAIGMGISRFVYTPILPAMRQAAGLTPDLAGYLATANYLGYLLGALWPLLVRKLNLEITPHRYLLGSLVLAILTTAGMAFTDGFAIWMLIRLIAGIASAWIMVYASAIVLDLLAAAKAPQLVALHYAGVGIGITTSGLLVAILADWHPGWKMQWIGATGLIIAFTPLAWRIVSSSTRTDAAALSPPGKPLLSQAASFALRRDTQWLIASYFCFGLGYVVTATFLPLIARQSPALANLAAMGWILVGLAAIPSNVLWVRVAQQLGYIRALMIAYAVEALGVVLPAVSSSPFALLASAILLGGTFMGITAVANACARTMAPARAAEILAAMTAAFGAGQMAGPAIAGKLAAGSGNFAGGLWVATAVLVAGIVLLAFCRQGIRPDRQ